MDIKYTSSMVNKVYENQKRTLNYSKSRVEKAGRDIRHRCDGALRQESIEIIQNFREVHLYPLMLIKNHLIRTAKKVSKTPIVVRRLKRLPTIIDKLERSTLDGKHRNAIQLTRMQDIGGCRAILGNIQQVKKLHERLKQSKSVHRIIKTDNYLTPKDSGYSGIHLIYSCYEKSPEKNQWKKTKIEVQLRTELQHAWATSLEIIDTLEGINLKTSMTGHESWRRFFKLAGVLVAHTDKACEISQDEMDALIVEMTALEKELEVIRKLTHYQLAISVITDNKHAPREVKNHQGMFLVTLFKPKFNEGSEEPIFSGEVLIFRSQDLSQGLEQLAANEADDSVLISVMVSANDVRSLKRAYPNYFGDTVKFQTFLNTHLLTSSSKS